MSCQKNIVQSQRPREKNQAPEKFRNPPPSPPPPIKDQMVHALV